MIKKLSFFAAFLLVSLSLYAEFGFGFGFGHRHGPYVSSYIDARPTWRRRYYSPFCWGGYCEEPSVSLVVPISERQEDPTTKKQKMDHKEQSSILRKIEQINREIAQKENKIKSKEKISVRSGQKKSIREEIDKLRQLIKSLDQEKEDLNKKFDALTKK